MSDYTETLHAIYEDPHIWSQEDRATVTQACIEVLREHGELHISLVRPKIGDQVAPHRVGANIHGFARRAHLAVIDHRPNGGGSGNRNKLSPVWARKESA